VIGSFEIGRLGAQGDGIADTGSGPVFIRHVLPGEVVTAARAGDRAELISILERSAQRIEPACRHFGICGGCALQHFEARAYLDWKRERVDEALRRARVPAEAGDIVACPPHARRRVVLSARRTASGMLAGYNRALSHTIFDVEECPIALPEIVGAVPSLRRLAALVAATPDAFRLTVTATASGLDVAVQGSGRLDETRRRAAGTFALGAGLARLSIDGEIVVEPRRPVIMFDGIAVEPPPGAFLQATAAAERAMADLVRDHVAPARRVADLFAGCGSFALRLARSAEVHAVEGDAALLGALDKAFRGGQGLKRVSTERRDLHRRPLTASDLAAFEALVFDPPRAGAEDQSAQIARSAVPLVAAVSCNPGTLARDLSILVAGGYRVKSVTAIDQFLWSPHVEAVALLEKPKKRRPGSLRATRP
jgi:23S rRNA (uracil1939-C5)-methyltransferase